MKRLRGAAGFSLIELLFATGLLLVVSSIVTTALIQMTNSQKTIWNRTEMHSGIRGATELLQQEVGQAGRIATPESELPLIFATGCGGCNGVTSAMVQPTCDPAAPSTGAVTVSVDSVAGLWATSGVKPSYVMLTTMDGNNQESFRVASINAAATPPTITACFTKTHAPGAVLMPLGGFVTGIVPNSGVPNGSNGSVLKLYGDINGDGNMVYVEYTCDTVAGKLYRNVMPWNTPAASKPPNDDSMVLLANVKGNPGNAPCFTYQLSPPIVINGTSFVFVLDVAITLTVETEQIDPITKVKQTETKALLNVSPRNVFNAWEFAGMSYTDRIQSTPTSVMALVCKNSPITCP